MSKVAGEQVDDLWRALLHVRTRKSKDGMTKFSMRIPEAEAGPFMRALMRIEAELLVSDADAPGELWASRTPDHRRADALVELVKRMQALRER